MAQQYLEEMQHGIRTGNLTHRFMAAGEQALDVLDRAGLVEEYKPETYRFTARGREMLDRERFA
jgi:ribosomal protein S19E (S16A)